MDVVNLKISKVGGLTKARQIRDLCVSLGIAMTIEDTWGGDIVTAAIAHLAQSTPPRYLFSSTDFNSYVTVSIAEGAPQRHDGRQEVTGAEVDLAASRTIASAGFERGIASRTGHSIDRFGLHGFGPPIDGTETDDRRLLVPGVGFSIEPGIYLEGETGVRSEVNVYLTNQEAVVTPREYQKDLIIV
jgi:hypothetical protein